MTYLVQVLSQYGILERTAQCLSTLDLFHLARTCSELYSNIRQTESVFSQLKRLNICDGRGLVARQEYQSLYGLDENNYVRGRWARAEYDEEIEVRVWNVTCDAANALPCLRCKINVCEVCSMLHTLSFCIRISSRPCAAIRFSLCGPGRDNDMEG